ncbi:ankyrin repeat domain-containing protein 12 isoform X3 [Leptidea sinapis]|uniref:ankyrin repeat domain-containing protein 12 isoform X3 n=1 Tax=Leptidea sinapis TaxID=189913 RepID=UPI0021C3BE2B|nr:ankyrin repeat domain-containing protein 12 isoform X3 [Leptidea sinapis]
MPSTSRSRGSGRGPDGAPRSQVIAPMSERQQLALVMQISSQDAPPAAPTPAEERKRTRQQRNERGETPLHVAAIRGDHEQVRKIINQGQDPNVTDFAGWTPLHEACNYGWLQVVAVLVSCGANVNAKGLDDDTPLHDAATSGNLKMVKFLIEHGAQPFAKNSQGKSPADYAAPHVQEYLQSLKDNARAAHNTKTRDDSTKKIGNASTTSEACKRSNMESLAQGEFENKEATAQEKVNNVEIKIKEEGEQVSSGVVSSTQDDSILGNKKLYIEIKQEPDQSEDDVSKRKKRKDNDDKESIAKPSSMARGGTGRILTGSKPPGPASKTGATMVHKGGASLNVNKSVATSSTGKLQTGGKGSAGTKGKSGSNKALSTQIKQERRSPVPSPKSSKDDDSDDLKPLEAIAPKVPPLKIVIPGGAGGSGSRNEQEDGGSGQRGSGKGRGNASTLPYVLPCTTTDAGQTSDSSDGNSDDKRSGEGGKGGQRVLRSHRTNDGEKDQTGTVSGSSNQVLGSNKSPPPTGSGQDDHGSTISGSSGGKHDTAASKPADQLYLRKMKKGKAHLRKYKSEKHNTVASMYHSSASGPTVELHPRKRKLKSSRDNHLREIKIERDTENSVSHNVTHSNPYQMYIHKRKQIERRQKTLFPVKPKPPKDFNKYLMNRCTYTLQNNVNPEPQVEIPITLPQQMITEFMSQERERTRLRIQHQVEKEKLVLAVEQEILRVHGRAERAVANQALPFSVCTILRDKEVYNVLAPEQEEKRNAQRSRCNGRQINSWLQEVDDKWEKIKEGMLRRQHTEAETLHAVQAMGWEWKLKELGLCDHKITPKIDPLHVPQIHVSNFDLPA